MNYQRIYNQLIEKAQSQNREKGKGIYYEIHHIIPTCVGGTGKKWEYKTHPNLVLLTAKEHFIAHRLLCQISDNPKLANALWRMCTSTNTENNKNRNYRISSRTYEHLRKRNALAMSNQLTGRPKPDGFGDQLSDKLKGRVGSWTDKKQSAEHVTKRMIAVRKANTGRKLSQETIEKRTLTRSANKAKCKPILMLAKDGTLLREFESLKEAKVFLGRGDISGVLNGNHKHAGGFIWKYKEI
jgi:hypothetical protein